MKIEMPKNKKQRGWVIVGIIIAIIMLFPFWMFLLGGWLFWLIWKKSKTLTSKIALTILVLLFCVPVGIVWTKAYYNPDKTVNTRNNMVKNDNSKKTPENSNLTAPQALTSVQIEEQKKIEALKVVQDSVNNQTPSPQSVEVKDLIPSFVESLKAEVQNLQLVTRVVDGDTIDVEGVGRIRMIGMDTPETVDPRKPVQCFGMEASNKAKELLSNKKVRLESDPTQGDKDIYGRSLRYVYMENGTLFNKWMVENGYAHEYTYNIPYKFMDEFKLAERQAREASCGLWASSTCSGNTNQTTVATTQTPTTPAVKAPSSNTQIPSSPTGECLIKGNISSTKEKIYHVPGGGSYKVTVIDLARGERWFCTESEAVAAGWRKAKN